MNKILVIEDDKNIRETICDILAFSGYELDCAENGQIGLDKAKLNTPDLVICDVMMPVLNGWETIEAFRSTSHLFGVPFIFLSALSGMSDFRKGMNFGADDYLTKPFNHEELLTVVEKQIDKVFQKKKQFILENENIVNETVKKIELKVKEETKGFMESLERAKIIQDVILPNMLEMEDLFPKHFIYYEPKESLSGDFYWVKNINGIKLVAVADCTGHGVPGALLSMVFYNILNNIVDQLGIKTPARILTMVNTMVKQFMAANHKQYTGDGMDIALCAIDENKMQIKFAGASRPVYIITDQWNPIEVFENKIKFHENPALEKLIEIRGSIYSIGNADPNFKMEEQMFSYKNGDSIYLCSDGFVDQFWGIDSRKYLAKNFKNLLLSIQKETLLEQKKIVANAFEMWKGQEEQIDDVTILGINF